MIGGLARPWLPLEQQFLLLKYLR